MTFALELPVAAAAPPDRDGPSKCVNQVSEGMLMRETREPTELATNSKVFTKIHDENQWRGSESVSGPGSALKTTELLRKHLERVFIDLDIRVLCDAPCGDANWITEITGELDYYFGFDIVETLITKNAARHDHLNHFFRVADVSRDILPKADAILCRDCIVHFPLELGLLTIENFKRSGSTYLITTTFPSVQENRQCRLGSWRPLNLTAPPFDLPEPMLLLRERIPNPEDRYNDKSQGVWRLSDL